LIARAAKTRRCPHGSCRFPGLVAGPVLILWAALTMAAEFSGPIALPQDGASLSVVRVRLPGVDQDYFATGSGDGFLNLNRYNLSNRYFTVLHRLYVGGRVTMIVPWQGPEAPPMGVVVATTNPDRVLFVKINTAYPFFEISAEVALAEDPGDLAYVGAVPGGAMELAVGLPGVDRVVFVGQSAGMWSVLSETATGDDPSSLVGMDLDGDGVRELVVAQTGPLSRTLGVLRRQPDGSYPLETISLPGVAPALVTAWDLDGDGKQELAVAGAENPLVIFYAADTGSLVEIDRTNLTILARTFHLTRLLGGSTGLFAASEARGLLEFSSLDNGQWQRRDTYYPGCRPRDFAFADADGDGLDDLIAVGGEADLLTLMLGDERPGFAGFPAFGLDRSPGSFVSDDIDGDGWRDLLLSDADETTLSLSRGLSDGSLSPVSCTLELGFRPGYILGANMDADPALELAVLDFVAAELVILDYSPTSELTVLSRTPAGVFPYFIAAGDLDADQAVDLMVLSQDDQEVAVFFGTGEGTVDQIVTMGFEAPAHWIVPLDLDGDGLLDLAATDGNSRVWTLTNSGGRRFGSESFVNAGSGALHMSAGDLDGDQDDDLVVANRNENTLSFFENDGSGSLVRRIGGYALTGQPAGVVLADFNRDGRLDVLLNLKNDEILSLVFWVSNWSYSLPAEIPGGPEITGIDAVDFNLDGVPDILALDRSLLLGLTLLNSYRGQVAVAATALTASCQDGVWELRVRPDRPGPWRVELKQGRQWRVVMVNGHAFVGQQDFDGDTWILQLDKAELRAWSDIGGEVLQARLTVGEGPDEETDTRTFAADCTVGASPDLPRVEWQREPWPNPFNPSVRARIALGRAGPLRIAVFDLAGHRVSSLVSGDYPAGNVEVQWDGSSGGSPVGAGVYLLRVETTGALLQRKLILIK